MYYDIIYHPFIGINEEITEVLTVGVDVTDEVEKEEADGEYNKA